MGSFFIKLYKFVKHLTSDLGLGAYNSLVLYWSLITFKRQQNQKFAAKLIYKKWEGPMENEPSFVSGANNNEAAIMAARRVNRGLGNLATGAFGLSRRTAAGFVNRMAGAETFSSHEDMETELLKNDVRIGLRTVHEAGRSDDSIKAGWGAAIAARGVMRATRSEGVPQDTIDELAQQTADAFDRLPSEAFIPLPENEIDLVRSIAVRTNEFDANYDNRVKDLFKR